MRLALLCLLLTGCATHNRAYVNPCSHYVINGRTVTVCPAGDGHVWVRDGDSYGRLP